MLRLPLLAALVAAAALPAAEPLKHDAAFDRFVSPVQLQYALVHLDQGRLADAADRVARGERELGRPRAGLTADGLYRLAIRVAVDRHDPQTLTRLAAALKAGGRLDL